LLQPVLVVPQANFGLLKVSLQGSHAPAGFFFSLAQLPKTAPGALDLLLDVLLPLLQLVDTLRLRWSNPHPSSPQQEGQQPQNCPCL
jgi:hypothetical protein